MEYTQELKDEICLLFNEGKFLSDLSIKYKIPKVWLISFLQEKGINPSRLGQSNGRLSNDKRKELAELYNSGFKISEVATKMQISKDSVNRYLKKLNITTRTRSDYSNVGLDHNYFETIDSSEKAYYLGFIAADGYNKESKVLEISLHPKDRVLLENFLKAIKSDRPIAIKKQKYVYISIHSKVFMKHLEKHGIVSCKSSVLEYPKTLPDKFKKDYDRGYFDGDGYISANGKNVEILGTENVLLNISENVYKATGMNPSCILQRNNIYRLFYCGGKKTAKLYNYFYTDSVDFLERKNLRFKNNKYV